MKRRTILFLFVVGLAVVAAGGIGAALLLSSQSPQPVMPLLAGERSRTVPSPTPVVNFRTYRATQATKLYAISGTIAAGYRRAAPGRAYGQVLYSIWVSSVDPGPGPWPAGSYSQAMTAMGKVYARPGNLIQKLEAEPYEGTSETVPVRLDFNGAPIMIPAGAYLTLLADYSLESEAGTSATSYGEFNYEAMLSADVDHAMDQIVRG